MSRQWLSAGMELVFGKRYKGERRWCYLIEEVLNVGDDVWCLWVDSEEPFVVEWWYDGALERSLWVGPVYGKDEQVSELVFGDVEIRIWRARAYEWDHEEAGRGVWHEVEGRMVCVSEGKPWVPYGEVKEAGPVIGKLVMWEWLKEKEE